MNDTSRIRHESGTMRRRSFGATGLALLSAITLMNAPRAGATELQFHGLLDLVATGRGPAVDQNVFTRGDSPFDPAGVRLFADATVNDRTQVFTEAVLHDASSIYLYGAYIVYTPFTTRDLHLLAGKLPWAIGTWGARSYSSKNPLIGTPLMYSHHTTLLWYDFPPDADALVKSAGTGATGVDYHGYTEGSGMPIIDDSYWDVGLTIAGSQRPLEYSLGVIAGTPSWGSTMQDDNRGKCMLGRVGLAPTPWLRVGASGSYGPYLSEHLDPTLPKGKNANDYHQKLAMADLEVLAGHVELRAEGVRNFWETPTVGELESTGGYLEGKLALPLGWFLAGRYDVLTFGQITQSTGNRYSWDNNVKRLETGAGYRFNRDVTGKLVYQRTQFAYEADKRTLELFAAQLSVGF